MIQHLLLSLPIVDVDILKYVYSSNIYSILGDYLKALIDTKFLNVITTMEID